MVGFIKFTMQRFLGMKIKRKKIPVEAYEKAPNERTQSQWAQQKENPSSVLALEKLGFLFWNKAQSNKQKGSSTCYCCSNNAEASRNRIGRKKNCRQTDVHAL